MDEYDVPQLEEYPLESIEKRVCEICNKPSDIPKDEKLCKKCISVVVGWGT